MSSNDKKEEVKKLIRSLLLSVQGCSDIRQLESDYPAFTGEPIPYHELGFSTLEEFLKNIPDVVRIYRVNNRCLVGPVADETTKHIDELVQKQRPAKRKKTRSKRTTTTTTRPARYNETPRGPTKSYNRLIPVSLRCQIQKLLEKFQSGLCIYNFEKAFKTEYGIGIGHRFLGFEDIEELLSEMHDTVLLQETSNGLQVRLKAHYGISQRSPEHTSSSTVMSGTIQKEHSVDLLPAEEWQSSDEDEQNTYMTDATQLTTNLSEQLNPKVCDNFRQILSQHQDGIDITLFAEEYEKLTKTYLDIQELGFHSTVQMISELPEIFTLEETPDNRWILHDARRRKKDIMLSTVTVKEPTQEKMGIQNVCKRAQANILRLLQLFPDGIPVKEFPSVYKMNFREELQLSAWGFDSVLSLLEALSEHFPLYLHIIGGVSLVKLEKDKVEPWLQTTGSSFRDVFSSMQSCLSPIAAKDIPVDAVPPGATYKQQTFPEDVDMTQYMGVYVSNVDHPGHIWVQLRRDDTSLALEKLMDKMEQVYTKTEGSFYKVPPKLLMIGLCCVAVYPDDKSWHRVKVVGIPNEELVEVFYVDYGDTCCVKQSQIRLLKEQFFSLPAQAIEATLAGIRPIKGKVWCRDAKVRLVDLVRMKRLMGLFNPPFDRAVQSVYLCDTTGEEDLHINDVLIAEGFAAPLQSVEDEKECEEPTPICSSNSWLANLIKEHTSPKSSISPVASVAPFNMSQSFPSKTTAHAFALSAVSQMPSSLSQILMDQPRQLASSSQSIQAEASAAQPSSIVENTMNQRNLEIRQPSSAPDIHRSAFKEEDLDNPNLFTQHIRCAHLRGPYTIHVISYKDEPYITSRDLSSLFSWAADLIESMLGFKKHPVQQTQLHREQEQQLFSEMDHFKMLPEGKMDKVKLYPFKRVPELLNVFSHTSKTIRDDIAAELEVFAHWNKRQKEKAKSNHSSIIASISKRPLNELQLILTALEIKRKDLIAAMAREFKQEQVDKLNSTEQQIGSIKELMKKKQTLGDAPDQSENDTHLDEDQASGSCTGDKEDPLIENIVAALQQSGIISGEKKPRASSNAEPVPKTECKVVSGSAASNEQPAPITRRSTVRQLPSASFAPPSQPLLYPNSFPLAANSFPGNYPLLMPPFQDRSALMPPYLQPGLLPLPMQRYAAPGQFLPSMPYNFQRPQ